MVAAPHLLTKFALTRCKTWYVAMELPKIRLLKVFNLLMAKIVNITYSQQQVLITYCMLWNIMCTKCKIMPKRVIRIIKFSDTFCRKFLVHLTEPVVDSLPDNLVRKVESWTWGGTSICHTMVNDLNSSTWGFYKFKYGCKGVFLFFTKINRRPYEIN